MNKLFTLLLICVSSWVFGQSITVVYPTPQNSMDNTNLIAQFTPPNGANGPFTVSLIKTVTYMWQYSSCTPYSNSTTTIVSNTGNSSPITLTLPSGLEASGTTFGYYPCSQFFYNNYNKYVSYHLVVSNSSIQSPNYSVVINSGATTGTALKSMSLSQSQICQGNPLDISFLHQGVNAGNTFTIEVSDQNGSFNAPLVTANISGNTATTATLNIPANAPSSNNYKVKVSSSDPVASMQASLSIGIQSPVISGNNSFCENSPINLTSNYSSNSNLTYEWQKDGNVISNGATNPYEFYKSNVSLSDAGEYKLKVTHAVLGCNAISAGKTVTIDAAPSTPTTAPLTILNGNQATLTASGCSGTVYWYSSLTNNFDIGTGTYTTPELTQQTTYYAACRQNSGAYCYSSRTPLVVSIDATNAPNAPTLTASHNNFCQGSVSSPKLTATGCTGIVRWYYKYNVTDTQFYLQETDNAAPYEFNVSNSQTRIYAADCRVNGVLSTSRIEITITTKPLPSPPNTSPSYGNVNNGSTLTLNAFGCSGTVKWYADNTTTTVLATGSSYTTPTLVNNDPNNAVYYSIYYTCEVDGCESRNRNSSGFDIYNAIVAPTFSYTQNTNNVCSGNSKTIYANGCSNGTVNWYDDFAGGNLLGTGASYITPTLNYNSNGNNSYYYYADCTIGGNTSSRSSANLYVYQQPTTPSANQPTIACNATATLTATGCNTSSPEYFNVRWYANNTTTDVLSYNTSFTTPNLAATTTYYLECRGSGDCKSARVPITVTVSCAPPDAPVIAANPSTVCQGVGTTLTATGCTGTVNWSDGGTGATRSNVVFNVSTSLTATCTVGSLTSGNSNTLPITVNPKPTLVITNPAPVAPPATVNLTLAAVTAGSTLNGGTLSYYTDAAGMIALTTPPPTAVNASGTYYIKATLGNCTDIKPVVVVINNCNTALSLQSTADDLSTGTHLKKTNETITATNIISGNANVTYRSNKSITLLPQTNAGFKADNGTVFVAEIGGCN
jgi:Ig-like domain CHU_C associated